MIKILGEIPDEVLIAVSGGPDSMACLDFLRRGGRRVEALHFHHGDSPSDSMMSLVESHCSSERIPLAVGRIRAQRPKGKSWEAYWRDERYRFLDEMSAERSLKVVVCHHLDDQVETWLWSTCHGTPKLIPHTRGNVIRPFLTNTREELRQWCVRRKIPFADDPLNTDERFIRPRIRHKMIPEALRVNPGIRKVVRRLVTEEFKKRRGSCV